MREPTVGDAGRPLRRVGDLLELRPGAWVRASAIASVEAAAPAGAADPAVLASVLDAEGVAGSVAAELERAAPLAPARQPPAGRPAGGCLVRLLGETEWQRCAHPVDILLEALAAADTGR